MKSYRTTMSLMLLVLVALLAAAPASVWGQSQQEEEAQPQEEQQAPEPDPEVEAARAVFQASNPARRVELAEAFMDQYPDSTYLADVYRVAAEAHRMQQHFDKAVEYGERALELNPSDAYAMLLVAGALSEVAQPGDANFDMRLNQAEDYSRQALDLLPEVFAKVEHRADVPEEQYKLEEQAFEAQLHGTLGFVYLRRQKFTDAETELQLATDLNQLQPSPIDFYLLGVAQAQQGKYVAARPNFQRCLDLTGGSSASCQKGMQLVNSKLGEEPSPEAKPQE